MRNCAGEKRSQPEEMELPDDLVSGRLERSLGEETAETPVIEIGEEGVFAPAETGGPESVSGEGKLDNQFPMAFEETPVVDEPNILDSLTVQGKDTFFEGLEVRFGDVGEIETGEGVSEYELYPEDEALLWGSANQPASEPETPETPISAEDIWGSETESSGYGSDLRREIWGSTTGPDAPLPDYFDPAKIDKPATEDSYAATYLIGDDFLPAMVEEPAPPPDELLSTILDSSSETEESASVQDLRAIALEDYEEGEFQYSDYTYKIDWGDEDQTAVVEEEMDAEKIEQGKIQEAEALADTRQALSTDWKSWFANRKTIHKILIVEIHHTEREFILVKLAE